MKRDVAKFDLPTHARQRYWMGVFLYMNLRIQDLANVLASRHGHLQVVPTETQITDRFKETLDVEHKSNQAPGTEISRQHHGPTTDDDQRNTDYTQQLNAGEKRSGEPRGREVGHEMGSI